MSVELGFGLNEVAFFPILTCITKSFCEKSCFNRLVHGIDHICYLTMQNSIDDTIFSSCRLSMALRKQIKKRNLF